MKLYVDIDKNQPEGLNQISGDTPTEVYPNSTLLAVLKTVKAASCCCCGCCHCHHPSAVPEAAAAAAEGRRVPTQ